MSDSRAILPNEKCVRVAGARLAASPRLPDTTRLSVDVSYPSRLISSETAWIEFPSEIAEDACLTGDPWLIAFLPLAVTLRLPLVVDLPVDPEVLSGAYQLMRQWSTWFPDLRPVPIQVHSSKSISTTGGERTLLFFSGGIDSFFSLLQFQRTTGIEIDDLIHLHGYDMDLKEARGFDRSYNNLNHAVAAFGKSLIPVASNLRQTRFQDLNWNDLGHGVFLGAVGLALGNRYRRVIISSGAHPENTLPAGTHAEVDPHFSSSRTEFVHWGDKVSRTKKLELIAATPPALQHLRVCYHISDGQNCGWCLKCIFAMSLLEVMGDLKHCHAFPGEGLDLDYVGRIYVSRGKTIFRLVQAYAEKNGRLDVAQAIEAAFQRTSRIDRSWMWLLRGFRERFRHHAGIRFVTRRLRFWLYGLGNRINRFLP